MEVLHVGSGEMEVELLPELGARLHRLRAFGHDLLRTPDDVAFYRDEPFFWGGFVMAPWCNRIEAHPTSVDGRTIAVPSNFADGTAIHGQVQDRPWEALADGHLRVAAGGRGWPWSYSVEQRVAVEGAAVRLELELVNRSDAAMPAGIGLHPWFRQPLEVRVPADRAFAANYHSAREPQPVRGAYDLRTLRQMPPDLDATWSLRGQEAIRLRWPELRLGAELRARGGGYLCMASPEALGAVAVEPQTHAPDGLRRLVHGEAGALRRLGPGERLELTIELHVTRDG